MARPATTPAQARASLAQHVSAAKRALVTLTSELSDTDVCYCDAGSGAGITESECGCQYVEAAKILEAAGCYARRAVAKGLL